MPPFARVHLRRIALTGPCALVDRYDLSHQPGPPTKEQIEAEAIEVEKVQLSLQLNLAAVLLKLGEPRNALPHANHALTLAPQNVKALFRRAQASSHEHARA